MDNTLWDYLLVLYERRRTMLVIIVSAVVSAGSMGFFIPPKYQAKIIFFIAGKPDTLSYATMDNPEDVRRALVLPVPSEDIQAIYIGFLRSRALMEKVGQPFGMNYQEIKKNADIRVSNEFLIETFVRDRNPVRAADIANAFPKALNQFIDNVAYTSMVQKRISLETEVDYFAKKLNEIEKKISNYKKRNNFVSIGDEIKKLEEKKVDYQFEIQNNGVNLTETDGKIKALEDALKKEGDIYSSSTLLSKTELVSGLQSKLADIEASIAAMKIDFKDTHPELKRLHAQSDQLKAELSKEVEGSIRSKGKDPNSFYENLRRQYINNVIAQQTLVSKISGMRRAIATLDERLFSLPDIEQGIESLEQEAANYRKIINNLRMRLGEVQAQEKHGSRNVVIVSPAIVPERPVFPEPVLNMLVAALLGLAVGIFYSFFIEYIRSRRNVEETYQ